MPSFYPQSRKAPNRPVIRHLLSRGYSQDLYLYPVYIDTLTALRAAILIEEVRASGPAGCLAGVGAVRGASGAVFAGNDMRKLWLCCRGPATPGQQRDPPVATPNRTAGEASIQGVPPEGCSATARRLSSRVRPGAWLRGVIPAMRVPVLYKCLYCPSYLRFRWVAGQRALSHSSA